MTDNQIRAGIDTFTLYGEEAASYGTKAADINKLFGNVTAFSANPSRNLIKLRGFKGVLPAANTTSTARDAHQILRGNFEGSGNVAFNPFNFRWMKVVLGTESGAGTGASKYNYPQATASSDADKKKYLRIPSLTISENNRYSGTSDNVDRAFAYLGSMVNSCTINGNVGEPVSVSLDYVFGDMSTSTTLETPVATPTNDVYHFVGTTLEIPTASAIDNIFESFSLTITNDVELLRGQGSDKAKQGIVKERNFEFSPTLTNEGVEFLKSFMGSATALAAPTEIASITLKMVSETNKNVNIVLLRCKIDNPTKSQDYPNVVKEGMTIHPQVIYVVEQTEA